MRAFLNGFHCFSLCVFVCTWKNQMTTSGIILPQNAIAFFLRQSLTIWRSPTPGQETPGNYLPLRSQSWDYSTCYFSKTFIYIVSKNWTWCLILSASNAFPFLLSVSLLCLLLTFSFFILVYNSNLLSPHPFFIKYSLVWTSLYSLEASQSMALKDLSWPS